MIRPILNRVVIEPAAEGEKITPGGIVLPDSAKQTVWLEGTVIAVGPGRNVGGTFEPVCVNVGDVVLYSQYAGGGAPQTVRGKKVVLAIEDDIYGVIEPAARPDSAE